MKSFKLLKKLSIFTTALKSPFNRHYSFLTMSKPISYRAQYSITNFPSSENILHNDDFNKINNIFLNHFNAEGFALDVGCGTGESTKLLSFQYPELKWYGVDTSEKNIKIAQKRFTNNEFINLNIEEFNLIRKNIFSIVNINEYDNLMITFVKSMSVLSQGGLLIYNCKTTEDVYTIRNYLKKNKITPSKEFLNLSLTYHIYDKKIFVFK